MINLDKKKYKINGASSPLYWTLTPSNSCISTKVSNGVINSTSGEIDVDILLSNNTCSGTVTLLVEDDYGCSSNLVITVNNPCTSLVTTIIDQDKYKFLANPSGGTPPYTYTWSFDEDIFSTSNNTNQTLNLDYIGDGNNSSTNIYVKITDSKGCEVNATLNYSFCNPVVSDIPEVASCYLKGVKTIDGCSGMYESETPAIDFSQFIESCDGIELDYETLQFNLNSNFCYKKVGDFKYKFYVRENTPADFYEFTYSIKTVDGVSSNTGNLYIKTIDCSPATVSKVAVADNEYKFQNTEASSNPTIELSIDDKTFHSANLDNSSFTFIAGNNQTLSNAGKTLTTAYATVNYNNGLISYEVTSPPTDTSDLVQWRISDVNGSISNTANWFYTYQPLAAPVAVDDSLCTTCNNSASINILSNDTGVIDKDSIIITQAPTKGNYTNSQGLITYTPTSYGTDTIKYKVANPNGNTNDYSNEATLTINSICAGSDTINTLCTNDNSVDLTSYLSGFTSGGTWTQDGGNPTSLTISNPQAVDFSSGDDGTYTFTYTVTNSTCTDEADVVINKYVPSASVSTVFNDSSADSDGRFDITFTAGLTNADLSNGDFVRVIIKDNEDGSILSQGDMVVGSNPTELGGVVNTTNWYGTTGFGNYLESKVLDASTLASGITYQWTKRSWAIANAFAGINAGKELKIEVQSIKSTCSSTIASDLIEKVYEGKSYSLVVGTSSSSGTYGACTNTGVTTSRSGATWTTSLFDSSTLEVNDGSTWNSSSSVLSNPNDSSKSITCLSQTSLNPVGIRMTTKEDSSTIANISGVQLSTVAVANDEMSIASQSTLQDFANISGTINVTISEQFYHLHNIDTQTTDNLCPYNMTAAKIFIANNPGLSVDPTTGTQYNSSTPSDPRFDNSGVVVSNPNPNNLYTNSSQTHTFTEQGVYRWKSLMDRGNDYNCPSGDCNNIDWTVNEEGDCSGDSGNGAESEFVFQDALFVIASY